MLRLLACFRVVLLSVLTWAVLGSPEQAVAAAATAPLNSWTELDPAARPPELGAASMAYAASVDRVIAFGGDSSGAVVNQTWSYDLNGNTWTRIQSRNAPSPRSSATMVYVPSIDRVILFGGGGGNTPLNDLWAYDPKAKAWTQLHPKGVPPVARYFHSAVYVSSTDKVMIYGGAGEGMQLEDIWEYDPHANSWTPYTHMATFPSPRMGQAMAYAASIDRVIVFGGNDGENDLNDTWAFDPKKGAWKELHPAGDSPPGRFRPAMAYSQASGEVILFGGEQLSNNDGLRFNDTWRYDPKANRWTKIGHLGRAFGA